MVLGLFYGLRTRQAGHAPEAPAAEAPASAGGFRPSREQLAALRIVTVGQQSFRGEQVTEGKIALNGNLTTPVYSPYSGRVLRVLAAPGDTVHAGQPLLALEASEFAQAQNDLVAAIATLNTAKSQAALAATAERRKRGLYEARAGSQQDWQQSQADLASAQNAQRSAETALALVRNRLRILGRSDGEIARMENAERMDATATVTAPIAGTVIDRQVGPGQFIQSGASTPVFTIGDLRTLWLVANVREADVPAVRPGAAVEVHVMALPGKVFRARIVQVAPAVDAVTRRVAVRAEVSNPDGDLKPEMFATFTIVTGAESRAPGLPASAVVYEGAAAHVWVMREDGTLAVREVRVGRASGEQLEITQGLRAGERVVTSGALFIDRAAARD